MALGVALSVYAQELDIDKIERDLKVADNVLGTLIGEQNNAFTGNKVKSSYVKGYGVIFTIPQDNRVSIGVSRFNRAITISESNSVLTEVVRGYDGERSDIQSEIELEKEKLEKEREDKIASAKDFMADYAQLISQLEKDDKILVTSNNSNDFNTMIWASNREDCCQGAFSVETTWWQVQKFQQGSLKRHEFLQRVKVTISETVEGNAKSRDLEVFGSMLGRLYQADLSDTYYTTLQLVGYNRIEELGAIYNMKIYSSTENSSGRNSSYYITTIKKEVAIEEERNEIVKNMYHEFINSVRNCMVDYGRTIN